MGTEANEIEMSGIGFAVDQDQIGSDVAVPMVLPLTGKRVVAVAWSQRPIFRQLGENARKISIKGSGKRPFFSRL